MIHINFLYLSEFLYSYLFPFLIYVVSIASSTKLNITTISRKSIHNKNIYSISLNSLLYTIFRYEKILKLKFLNNLINTKAVFVLSFFFVLSIGGVLYYLYDYSNNIVLTMAKEDASSKIDALSSFRTLYAKEVVGKVKAYGMQISHEFQGKKSTIPLPATLTKLLGHKMGSEKDGSEAFLYSGYPFPWRVQKGGLNDSFRTNAWMFLTKNPTKTYSEISNASGRRVLRYARADIMRKSCIGCHNSHPQTPKADWKIGDVRGVLEVQRPMEGAITEAGEKAQGILWMVFSIGLLGALSLIGFTMMIKEVSASSEKVSDQFKSLKELRDGHMVLHKTIRGEKEPNEIAKNIISHLVDYLDISTGVIYLVNDKNTLKCVYGLNKEDNSFDPREFVGFENLIQKAGIDKKASHIKCDTPEDNTFPYEQLIIPILFSGKTLAVIALSSLNQITVAQRSFIEEASEGIGVTLIASYERSRVKILLDEAQDRTKELQSQKEKLKESNKEAQQVSRVKSDFLANMSHEIRTPMNGIIGILELIKDSSLSNQQKDLVETMENCGKGLVTVLNDILDYSKIDAGKMVFEKELFDINRLLKDIVFLFGSDANKKTISINYELNHDDTHWFYGDELRIRQILTNLVSNAIKFTDSGSILLSVIINRKPKQEMDVIFLVQDSGIGIEQSKLISIFKSFSQADTSTTRKYGGTGLGLSISYRLCELMGGKMSVVSSYGIGSTFKFQLPLTGPDGDMTVNDKTDQEKSVLQMRKVPMSILIVEDNIINQKVIIGFMKKIGYKVDISENGQQAIEAIENKKYDIVFMDMQMPVMGGIEATQIIIDKYGDNSPIIIAMTANVLEKDKEECLAAGMSDFLPKPISMKSLLSILTDVKV